MKGEIHNDSKNISIVGIDGSEQSEKAAHP